jgi:hypothetical protein
VHGEQLIVGICGQKGVVCSTELDTNQNCFDATDDEK